MRADDTIATGYRGTVTISADDGSGGKIPLIAHTYTMADSGTYIFTGLTITNVYKTNATRIIYTDDNSCNLHTQIPVAVWFHIYAYDFEPMGIAGTDACSGHPTYTNDSDILVALPDRSALCKYIKEQYLGNTQRFPVYDVGPMYSDTPYWNGTGIPKQAPDGTYRGMDNSYGAEDTLGISQGLNPMVLWRFD